MIIMAAVASVLSFPLRAQVETVEPASPSSYVWVSHGRVEGHLAINYSPDGAFSPDSATLAVVNEDKIFLLDMDAATMQKLLRPQVPGVEDLAIHSANYLAMSQLFLLAKESSKAKKVPRRLLPCWPSSGTPPRTN